MSSDMWSQEKCPHCGALNWVCWGNLDDCTGPDTESIQCFSCSKLWWTMDENEREEWGIDGPLEDSYSVEGRREAGFN